MLVAAAVPSAMAAFRTHSSTLTLHAAAGPARSAQGGQPPVAKAHVGVAHRDNLPKPVKFSKPTELHLKKAGSAVFDVRTLKSTVVKRERPEREPPGAGEESSAGTAYSSSPNRATKALLSPAPGPDATFDGLDFATWGAGHPPDTNGDVGPNYYIQTVNSSIGIYDKSSGSRVAAFTFNSFMSQGHFGNLCDTDNFGDPVVLYDSFENRWFITDFAFKLDGSGNVVNPPGAFQCFAVSKTGDPVTGGWNFYSIAAPGALNDYPKFGVWPDGIYMSANMFGYAASGSFISPHVWALNKQQMYGGAPSVQVVDFAAPSAEFTLLPANARLQTGTPPDGSPNYVAVVWQFLNAVSVYKFHVDWDKVSTSTFSGPFISTENNWWEQYSGTSGRAPTPANANDTLYPRLMVQSQYTNIGGVESLWDSHTVGAGNPGAANVTSAQSAVRFYQTKVTGGNVEAAPTQAWTYSPDASLFRYMPSVAADRMGDMAIGYTSSNSTTNPALKYAGQLAGDAPNTLSQDEQTLFQGTGAQSGNCGSSTCTRWGDYSAMSLDPNGCTFWYTNEYYAVNGLNDLTRIGSFHYPSCTPVGNGGSLSGTVTDGTNPLAGATVALGSRTATTDASGNYSFPSLPAGTYPTLSVSKDGFGSASAASIPVPDGGSATRNFTLAAAAQSDCLTDTAQSDFQRGVPANCDLNASPGDVVLTNAATVNQSNSSVTNSGFGFNSTTWAGQTFTPSASGQITSVDLDLFCSGCTGTTPNLTVSIRATSGGVPTGSDLGTATIAGFNSGAGGYYSATFATPIAVTAATQYAIVFRAVSNPSAGLYAYVVSSAGTAYTGGTRVSSSTSGSTWASDSTHDLGFNVWMKTGFPSSGTFVSSLKDANPQPGRTPKWTTLSFTATTPASTGVKFQVAASNSRYGPFSFVGPDGTSATFFTTSGASLSQFNGFRYLKYEAFLTTSDASVTPTLQSVSVCYQDQAPNAATNLAVDPASGPYGGTTSLSATLTSGGSPLANESVAFSLNGTSVGSTSTNASGVAALSGVSLAGIAVGSYPTGVSASFIGDTGFDASNGSNSLTVNQAGQTISVTTHAPGSAVFGSQFSVAATGGASGNAVTFSSGGGCTNSGATFTMTSGTSACQVKYDQAGDSNYADATQVVENVTAQKADQTITVTTHAPANAAYGSSFGVAANAPGGVVTFSNGGSCSNSGSTFTITSGTGTCAVKYDQTGSADYNAAPQVTESTSATTAPLTITANDRTKTQGTTLALGTTAFSTGGLVGSDGVASVTLTSTGAAASAPVGTYPIVPSSAVAAAGTNLGNYTIGYANGTLTVTAATGAGPKVTISRPKDGAQFKLGQGVHANYKCSSVNSVKVASCVGTVPSGSLIDTSTVGQHTFTVTGTDVNGNTTTVTDTYTIVYAWQGFFSPITNDKNTKLSVVHAGDLLKLGFGLDGNRGADVLAAGSPSSVQVTCPGWTLKTVKAAGTGTGTGLVFETSSNHYYYGWQTDPSWAGTCRQFQLQTNDGTAAHTATFKFFS